MQAGKIAVVIGGGIAGVSCVEALIQSSSQVGQIKQIILVSEERLVKRVINYETRGKRMEKFDVIQCDINELIKSNSTNFRFMLGSVRSVYPRKKYILIEDSECRNTSRLPFDVLCLCNGSVPRTLLSKQVENKEEINKRTIVIRDVHTVEEFQKKLSTCRHIAIVGNGGISLELVHKISNCEITWIVRDDSIGLPFFDSGAGKFLLDSRSNQSSSAQHHNLEPSYAATETSLETKTFGPSLGPNWANDLELTGRSEVGNKLNILYNDEIVEIVYKSCESEHPLKLQTKGCKIVHCDLVAFAIGVEANNLNVIGDRLDVSAKDGGILIDNEMRTNLDLIYAAGDTVSCENWPTNELWFQMRLWTQARQMGLYAGRCIAAHQVILLGQFNGQLLKDTDTKDCEIMARVNPGKDYVKVLIKGGCVVGAVLVGDSGLEETIENLIHDKTDVTHCKEQLLDGTVDIEDYFD